MQWYIWFKKSGILYKLCFFQVFVITNSILVQFDKCFTLKKNRKMINECHNNAFSFRYSQNKQFFLKKKIIWTKELQCILWNLKWVAILSQIFYLSNIVEQKSLSAKNSCMLRNFYFHFLPILLYIDEKKS